MKTKAGKIKWVTTTTREVDTDPDLSYLGAYTNNPTFPFYDRLEGVVIHNQEEFDALEVENRARSRECRYIHKFQSPEEDKSIILDARRLEDYGNGWGMMSVTASASIDGHEFGSAALGGIESDAGEEEFLIIEGGLIEDAREEAEAALAKFLAANCTHDKGDKS